MASDLAVIHTCISAPYTHIYFNATALQDTFTLNMLEVPQGAGSGIVWDSMGHIVTNYRECNNITFLFWLIDFGTYDRY